MGKAVFLVVSQAYDGQAGIEWELKSRWQYKTRTYDMHFQSIRGRPDVKKRRHEKNM